MTQFVSGISVVCFAASYAVALACEASRLVFRSGVRGAVMVGFAAAGLFAHTLFLGWRAATEAAVKERTNATISAARAERFDPSWVTAVSEPLPVIDAGEPMDAITRLFAQRHRAVLVREDGAVVGILTRFDMLQFIAAES